MSARLNAEELDAAEYLATNERVDIPSDVRALVELLVGEARSLAEERDAALRALRDLTDVADAAIEDAQECWMSEYSTGKNEVPPRFAEWEAGLAAARAVLSENARADSQGTATKETT